jgi:hypothetical protein
MIKIELLFEPDISKMTIRAGRVKNSTRALNKSKTGFSEYTIGHKNQSNHVKCAFLQTEYQQKLIPVNKPTAKGNKSVKRNNHQ